MEKKFKWRMLLSIHVPQLLKRLSHRYLFPDILSREMGLKMIAFVLLANDCNCVLQRFFLTSLFSEPNYMLAGLLTLWSM